MRATVWCAAKKGAYLLLLCLFFASSALADAQAPSGVEAGAIAMDAGVDEQSLSLGGVDVVVWSNRSESGTPQPVVVFSHGIGLCPTQTRFLTQALAHAGYLVVAPKHGDSSCDLEPSLPDPTALKPALMWSDRDYRDRADDVRNVVAALKSDARFRERADMTRLALAGHSLGGYTVLGLGGAWPTWTLPGIKAILALSPYSTPFRAKQGLRKLHAPVMYQGGTLDLVFTPPLRAKGGAFDLSPPPKYYVEIAGAAHFAWTDTSAVSKDAIVSYAIAFLDRYVKGLPEPAALHTSLPGTADFRRVRGGH
jgi:predicted dienelactone hydrolase